MKYWLSHLPLEVWVDCYRYPWIIREELGQIVDRFRNRKFAEYLQFYLHDWGRRRLQELWFDQSMSMFQGRLDYVHHQYPIPLAPVPENIKSFEHIMISNFDAHTMAFLRQLVPLLTGVTLKISISNFVPNCLANLRTILAHLLSMLNGINLLSFDVHALPTVRECFGNEALAKINILALFDGKSFDYYYQGLGEAQAQTAINFLVNWLTSPSEQEGGIEPKWCFIRLHKGSRFFEQFCIAIREDFLMAESPSTFVVTLALQAGQFAEFHLPENSIGEELHGVQIGPEKFRITRHRANRSTELQQWMDGKKNYGQNFLEIYCPIVGKLTDAVNVRPENVEVS